MTDRRSCRSASCSPARTAPTSGPASACCCSASSAIFLAEQLSRVNALKNVLSVVVNAVALVAFGIFGPVAWEAVLVVAATSLICGYLGARVARRIPSVVLRTAVVAHGVVVSVVLLLDA